MEAYLEHQRRLHEERERIIDTMVREWLHEKKTHKEKINSDHRLKMLLDREMDSTSTLAELYEDRDGSRRQEIQAIGGPNEFAEFYSRLKQLKDTHRRNPDEVAIPLSMEFQEMNELVEDPERQETDMVEFSDEEGYGRFLDLHEFFAKYINLKGVKKTEYLTYLSIYDQLFDIPKETRKTGAYKEYLSGLLDYLQDFLSRVKPLLDLNVEVGKAVSNFERQWADGTFPGWPKESTGALTHTGAYLDLSPFNFAEELKGLGLDRLKSALLALGLKCGGTIDERAERLFSTKGKKLEEIDPSLFAKKPGKAESEEIVRKEQKKQHDVACLEAQVYHLSELVGEERGGTRENVERRQARTVGEDEEDDEVDTQLPSDEEEDNAVPYNPKNLPLGWDGKPIPYWLYKLHGLNLSYPCEICGNQVYKGPKAFQRHFSEWRHSHGMRCLGIPNTAHFANITKISDAIELWQKLREKKERTKFKPELEEEYEDSQGNVVSRKTFEDLKRQGLL